MDSFRKVTFLSESVRYMVVEIGEKYYQNSNSSLKYLTPQYTLNWEVVETALRQPEKSSVLNHSPEWFVDEIHNVWPIYSEAHSVIQECTESDDLLGLLKWTSEPKEVRDFLFSFVNSTISTTETLLLLTAVIERSLGNLYLLKGTTVPSLLRDLLATAEIKFILGDTPVLFLQILLGTPSALNLRNLVWHGFPVSEELYPHFVSVLFVTILSIGELLISKNIDYKTIPKRPQTKYPETLFSNTFPRIKDYSGTILELLFLHDLIPQSHQAFWKQSMKHFVNERFGQALIILLPQFEHMLRCLFCRINNCSHRSLTAESVTLYTTMSEILAKYYLAEDGQDKLNKLPSLLGDPVMEILFDLFVYQEGPRIRDKISHGECPIYDVPEMLVNHIFCVAVVIVGKSTSFINKSGENKDVQKHVKIENDILLSFQQYELKFHPLATVKYNIKQSLIGLDAWIDEVNNECNISLSSEDQCSQLSHSLNLLYDKIQKNRFSSNEGILNFLSSLQVLTVLRPKTENEIMRLLKNVMENVEQITQQVKQSLVVMHQQYNMHTLRSRNRETYRRMLTVIPHLKGILFCLICIVILILEHLDVLKDLPAVEFEKLLKFCKVILQYVQNVISWTKQNKNRWLEIQGITNKLSHYLLSTQLNYIFPE